MLTKILRDFVGLSKVLGIGSALLWLAWIPLRLAAILRSRSLMPADRAMGEGPFTIRSAGSARPFKIRGPEAFSGIREMYVRDVYLRHGILMIEDGFTVVDLGANMGNFTNLAAAHGHDIRIVSVEPSLVYGATFDRSTGLNPGVRDQITFFRNMLGRCDAASAEIIGRDPAYDGVEWISEDELIQRAGLEHIDFLKCDIEGGEFSLMGDDSRLLAMADRIGIEIHAFAGNVIDFVAMLKRHGFDIIYTQLDPDGSQTVLGKRPELGKEPPR